MKVTSICDFLYEVCITTNDLMKLVSALFPTIHTNQSLKKLLYELFSPSHADEQSKDAATKCSHITSYFLYRLIEEKVGSIITGASESLDPTLWLD